MIHTKRLRCNLKKLGVSYNVSYKVCFTRNCGGSAGWEQGEEKRKQDGGEKEELVVSKHFFVLSSNKGLTSIINNCCDKRGNLQITAIIIIITIIIIIIIIIISIKYRHIFIKPYISNKNLLVYSTIHFRHCQELNDKNK